MFYLLLAIFSSAMISVMMRISTEKVKGKYGLLLMNYLVCTLLSAGYAGFDLFPAHDRMAQTVGLGFFCGVLFLGAFLLLQINVQKNGVVLSSIFMKLGLLVPMVLSIVFFGEMPGWLQMLGFFVAIGAMILINYEKGKNNAASAGGLILLLLAGGGADAMSKVFEEVGANELANQYLFYNFLMALLLCLVLVIRKREKIGGYEILFGSLLGVPNFFSTKFLLRALNDLPAVLAYPTFSVGTILAVTLAGVCLFHEKLRRRQIFAMIMILFALILLNL